MDKIKKKRKGLSFSIDMPKDLHRDTKVCASQNYTSMAKLMCVAMYRFLRDIENMSDKEVSELVSRNLHQDTHIW